MVASTSVANAIAGLSVLWSIGHSRVRPNATACAAMNCAMHTDTLRLRKRARETSRRLVFETLAERDRMRHGLVQPLDIELMLPPADNDSGNTIADQIRQGAAFALELVDAEETPTRPTFLRSRIEPIPCTTVQKRASRFGRRQAGKSFQAVFPLSATKNSRSSR